MNETKPFCLKAFERKIRWYKALTFIPNELMIIMIPFIIAAIMLGFHNETDVRYYSRNTLLSILAFLWFCYFACKTFQRKVEGSIEKAKSYPLYYQGSKSVHLQMISRLNVEKGLRNKIAILEQWTKGQRYLLNHEKPQSAIMKES